MLQHAVAQIYHLLRGGAGGPPPLQNALSGCCRLSDQKHMKLAVNGGADGAPASPVFVLCSDPSSPVQELSAAPSSM